MCFTDDYQSLSAFEVATQQNKYFNLERMAGVEVLDTKMMHEAEHEFHKPDIFGFQGKSMDKEIVLKLSLRASLVLREEYPMSIPYVKSSSDHEYLFSAQVQSFQAPGRFVLGFYDEITVLGSKAFIRYMAKLAKGL
jgi:predicted DNA-binding transcriptional regulator YafY